jgi:hypothetical protein
MLENKTACFRERDKLVYAVQGNDVCLLYEALEDICAVRTKWKCLALNLAVRMYVLISAFFSWRKSSSRA